MRRVVIKGSEWYRGRTVGSCLLRLEDGRRCCVGIDAKCRGVPDDEIMEVDWPLRNLGEYGEDWNDYDSRKWGSAACANDDSDTTDEEKIELLRPIFRNLPNNPAIIVWRPDL